MKHTQHIANTGPQTTPTEVCHWAQKLVGLHAHIAPRFARTEPRRRVMAYLQGILSETTRKNGWQLAEHAREARPDGMQRLLASAVLDTNGVRDAPLAPMRLSNLAGSRRSWSSSDPRVSQAGSQISRRWHAVLWRDGIGRELSSGSISLLCHGSRPYPD